MAVCMALPGPIGELADETVMHTCLGRAVLACTTTRVRPVVKARPPLVRRR